MVSCADRDGLILFVHPPVVVVFDASHPLFLGEFGTLLISVFLGNKHYQSILKICDIIVLLHSLFHLFTPLVFALFFVPHFCSFEVINSCNCPRTEPSRLDKHFTVKKAILKEYCNKVVWLDISTCCYHCVNVPGAAVIQMCL